MVRSARAAKAAKAAKTAATKAATKSRPAAAAKVVAAAAAATSGSENLKNAFPPMLHTSIAPHTLIVGTLPSDNSIENKGYFYTNENAFWHIAGDALGFRRGFHLKERTDAVDSIRPHLLHEEELDYDAAMDRLLSRGYAIWDVINSAERKGSLDSAIKMDTAIYSDIPLLLRNNPGIERICFATGSGSADIFRKKWKDWLTTDGLFRVAADEASQKVFGKAVARTVGGAERGVELCVMESVSPAYVPRQSCKPEAQRKRGFDDQWARQPTSVYKWKRAQWFETCYHREPTPAKMLASAGGVWKAELLR
jgi:G:T/U-mismatch repair DNA glycosylase